MPKLRSGVLFETRYPGPILGAVPSEDGVLLIDCPLRPDDGKEWVSQLASLGRPRYLAMLDHHPDRALGARAFDLPIVAQRETMETMRGWPDAFKGNAKPIGAEADTLKRITGVGKSVPDLSFVDELRLHLGEREILFWHRPGPTAGAMWVVLPKAKIIFIGDAVTISEPPYVGDADIDGWITSLDELRGAEFADHTLISGRDGRIEREHLNEMARFVRKIPVRLNRLRQGGAPPEAAKRMAKQLVKGYRLPTARRDQAILRLEAGLRNLYTQSYPEKG
jgi:glyoxylase-like metal-dependent hydrolase (beta-lactamase superfamily II)